MGFAIGRGGNPAAVIREPAKWRCRRVVWRDGGGYRERVHDTGFVPFV